MATSSGQHLHSSVPLGAELDKGHPDLANPLHDSNTLAVVDNVASEGRLLASGEVAADYRSLVSTPTTVSAIASAAYVCQVANSPTEPLQRRQPMSSRNLTTKTPQKEI